jgi:protein-disulfide isomerase
MRMPISTVLASCAAGVLLLAACGGTTTSSAPAAAAPRASAALPSLGSVDGKPIFEEELDREARQQIEALDNETAQRRLHMLWAGLEDAVGKRLLAKEAARRGISVETLREQEIFPKIKTPTEEELQQLYDQNADRIGVDYKTALPHLKTQLTAERARAAERELVDRLRETSQVRYTLPIPNLPRRNVDIGSGPTWGKKDARVTLVEFSDFQCPYCARASVVLRKLKELYPNELRIEFRDYPLPQHPQARGAAEAGRCAEEQGKFWEFHDLLFQNARALEADDLRKYAVQAGIDLPAFNTCLASDRPKTAVDTSLALGQKAGVDGTPALYLDGIKLIGLMPLPLMQAFIDAELARH